MANYPLESEARLSESGLWQIQRNYFSYKGIQAWNDEIPFFISSNAFISTRYAHLVIQYVLDRLDKMQGKFTICEVGAGPGKFTFYFLKAFEKALQDQNIELDYQYILTDVAQKNIDFCAHNEVFQPLVEANKLDFGVFDIAQEKDFQLINQGIPFSQSVSQGEVLFICNYVFDVIQSDLFQFEEDQLSEVRVSLLSRYERFDKEKPNNLKEVRFDFAHYPIEPENYYDNPGLNKLLAEYPSYFDEEKSLLFLLPTGAIQFIENMKQLTQSFMLICGDLGLVTRDELANMTLSSCKTYEGCYCFCTNFHALGEYMNANGGDSLLTKNRNSYKISLYAHGQSFKDMPKTRSYFLGEMESMGADEFCFLNDEFAHNNYRFDMKACLSFLRLSCYEPDTYFHMHDKVIDLLPEMNLLVKFDIRDALAKVEENLYHYQSFYDVFSLLGMFYLKVKYFKKAEYLFKQALKYSKNPFIPLRSLALLHDERGNSNQAIKFYRKALTYNKKDFLCKSRLNMLEQSPILLVKPILKAMFVFGVTLGLLYLVLMKP